MGKMADRRHWRDAVGLGRIAFFISAALLAAPTAYAQSRGECIRAETPGPGRLLAQSAPGMIALGRDVRTVKLKPVCAEDGRAVNLASYLATAAPGRRFLLVIEDIRAEAQPGVLFDLKLSGARVRGEGALLGALNFYAAQRPGVAARPRMISYDVTETLRSLANGRRLAGGLMLAIRPVQAPAPNSAAAIGRIALVEQ